MKNSSTFVSWGVDVLLPRENDRVGTARCAVTARRARGTIRSRTSYDPRCAARRGADAGGSATCEEQRPYQESVRNDYIWTMDRACSARFTRGDSGGSATCEERCPYQERSDLSVKIHYAN